MGASCFLTNEKQVIAGTVGLRYNMFIGTTEYAETKGSIVSRNLQNTIERNYNASWCEARCLSESGTVVASYEYDAFGDTIAQTGSHADIFRFRFSTKYHDPETGLYYYGYRFYDPTRGRWLNRDPIEEDGGLNLYAFCGNDGVNAVDVLGDNKYR
jgi:RHS repeat-associated protein